MSIHAIALDSDRRGRSVGKMRPAIHPNWAALWAATILMVLAGSVARCVAERAEPDLSWASAKRPHSAARTAQCRFSKAISTSSPASRARWSSIERARSGRPASLMATPARTAATERRSDSTVGDDARVVRRLSASGWPLVKSDIATTKRESASSSGVSCASANEGRPAAGPRHGP